VIEFTVYGIPAPKGSKSAFPIRRKATGKMGAVVVEGKTDRQKDWARRVEEVVQGLASSGAELLDEPLALTVTFYLPKPASAPKRRATLPMRKPDLDKLLRALIDPMTGVLVADDARFVEIFAIKRFAEDDEDPRPRAEVRVDVVDPESWRQQLEQLQTGLVST
jgi:Holliday junction resolvase RusA-like endonuclease